MASVWCKEKLSERERGLTFAGITGVERMRAMAQTIRITFRQLLMVQSERDRIGNTITMNLWDKRESHSDDRTEVEQVGG